MANAKLRSWSPVNTENEVDFSSPSSSLQTSTPADRPPTSSRYRWLVLACCYIIIMLSIGPGFTLGVYYNVLIEDFQASNTQVALITGFHPGMLLIAGAAASLLTASYGFRRVILAGGLMSSFGFALPYFFSAEIWQVQLSVGVIAAIGAGIGHVAAFGLIGFYFADDEHKRNLASLILVIAPETGNLIFAQVHRMLIAYLTWRGALLVVAGVILNIVPCALAIRDPEGSTDATRAKKADSEHLRNCRHPALDESFNSQRSICRRLVRSSMFWLIIIHAFFMGCYSTVITVFPRYATLERDFTMESATAVLSLASASTISARILLAVAVLIPRVHDQLNFFGLFHTGKLAGSLAMLLLPVWYDKVAIVSDFALITFGWGVKFGAYPIIIMKVLGPESLGFVWGFSTFVDGISCLAAPLLAGFLADQTGSFAYAYYLCGAAMLISGIPMVAVNVLHNKRKQHAAVQISNIEGKSSRATGSLIANGDSAAITPECTTAVEFCCAKAKRSLRCDCVSPVAC